MDRIKEFITGIIYAALIISILSAIPIQNKTMKGVLRFVCAMSVTIGVLSPVVDFKFPNLTDIDGYLRYEASAITASAADSAAHMQHELIIESVSAYILDKASALGAKLEVTVWLSDHEPYSPEKITLTGNISPYAKSILAEYMESQLGVSKEAQIWILDPQENN